MFTYIAFLAIFVWLPLAVLWTIYFPLLRKYQRTVVFCIFWTLVFNVPWDEWAIRSRFWTLPSETNLGISIGGIPLEEYLFYGLTTALLSTITLVLRDRARRWLVGEET